MKYIVALVLALIAGCQPRVDPPLHPAVEQNTWRLISASYRCTSFQIDSELIVSAGHCGNSDIFIFKNGEDVLPGQLVGVSATTDIALFFVPGANRPGLPVSKSLPREGDRLNLGGFPARVTESEVFSSVDVVSVDKDHAGGTYAHSMGPSVWPGMSGGPVLDCHNEVVGVISSISQEVFGDPQDPESLVRETSNFAVDLHNVLMEIINTANASIALPEEE